MCRNNIYQEFQYNDHICALNHVLYLEFTFNFPNILPVEITPTDEQTHRIF